MEQSETFIREMIAGEETSMQEEKCLIPWSLYYSGSTVVN